jgi:hypothetical protein
MALITFDTSAPARQTASLTSSRERLLSTARNDGYFGDLWPYEW